MIVLTDVQYTENNQKAFADSMGFKFPEEKDVWIVCDVKLCIQRQTHLKVKSKEYEGDLCLLNAKVSFCYTYDKYHI